MANPIFGRGEGFTKHHKGRVDAQAYQQPGYPGGYPQQPGFQGYSYQQQPGFQQPYGYPHPEQGATGYQQQPVVSSGDVMTYDDVIAKTGISLGIVFLVAMAGFAFLPIGLLLPVALAGGLAAFVTALVVAFRAKVSPAAVAIYAVFEGLFVGGISKYFELSFPGIVMQAVLATFVTAGVTLAVMKFGNIRLSGKFRQMVTVATFAFVGVALVNLALVFFGMNTGLRDIGGGAGWLSIGFSILAVCLAVFNLVMDFDSVRVGVENRAPASESWRAAFGITVTMVWLYIELLRILSYFRD